MHVSCNTLTADGSLGCLELLFILDTRETIAIFFMLKGGVLITCLQVSHATTSQSQHYAHMTFLSGFASDIHLSFGPIFSSETLSLEFKPCVTEGHILTAV